MELEIAISILSKVIFMVVGFALICALAIVCMMGASLFFITVSKWLAAKLKIVISMSDSEILNKYTMESVMKMEEPKTRKGPTSAPK